jgi:membrane protease YdiL (CAAX protease family)
MVEWRGDLWLAIGTHFAVDFISLLLLRAWVRRNARLLDGLN